MVIQVKIPFFQKFSSFVGNVFSMDLQPSYLWFQDSNASRLPLKGFGHQYGLLQLSSQNRTVRFWKQDCPVSAFLTPTLGETYPFTLISFPLSRIVCEKLLGPLGVDFLIPPWNLGVLGLIQLPKNRCIRFPHQFFLFLMYFHLLVDLFATWIDLKFLWCIVSIHVLEQSPAIYLSFIG
jgi:hypothetical protein